MDGARSGHEALEGMSLYQWGYIAGRLARVMADSVQDSLTDEAIDTVLRDFRRALMEPHVHAPQDPQYS